MTSEPAPPPAVAAFLARLPEATAAGPEAVEALFEEVRAELLKVAPRRANGVTGANGFKSR